MGSPFRIVMYCKDSLKAESAAAHAFALVDSLNAVFSDYDPRSELSRLNKSSGAGPVTVSQTLLVMLKRSAQAYQKSGGVFDVSVGPLSRAWRTAGKENRLSEPEIMEAKELVGFTRIPIDFAKKTVWLPQKGMSLDLGGIAKGYIAGMILRKLSQMGIPIALVDAGGDIAIGDPPPGAPGWVIGIAIPGEKEELFSKRLILKNRAVATSGSVYRYYEFKGKIYSHIIDPRTGYGISSPRNLTVIAGDAWVADWLATACSILPIEESKKLARKNGAELLIAESVSGQLKYYPTKRFYSFWK